MNTIREYREALVKEWEACSEELSQNMLKLAPVGLFMVFSSYLIPITGVHKFYSVTLPILGALSALWILPKITDKTMKISLALFGFATLILAAAGYVLPWVGVLLFLGGAIPTVWLGSVRVFRGVGIVLMLLRALSPWPAFFGAALIAGTYLLEVLEQDLTGSVGLSCSKLFGTILLFMTALISNVFLVIGLILAWKIADKAFRTVPGTFGLLALLLFGILIDFYIKSVGILFVLSIFVFVITVVLSEKWWVLLWNSQLPVLEGFIWLSFGRIPAQVGIGAMAVAVALLLWELFRKSLRKQ